MKKRLLTFAFVLTTSSFVFANDGIDYDKPYDQIKEQLSSFENRHSLMPKPIVEEKNNSVIENPVVADNVSVVAPVVSENANQNVGPKVEPVADVKATNEFSNTEQASVVEEDKTTENKKTVIKSITKAPENLDEFRWPFGRRRNFDSRESVGPVPSPTSVPVAPVAPIEPVKVETPNQKPEGYDELMKMAREQGGVIKPSNYKEDASGNLVLMSDEKMATVLSPVVEEKKENVVIKPLFGGAQNNVAVEQNPVVKNETQQPVVEVKQPEITQSVENKSEYSAPLVNNTVVPVVEKKVEERQVVVEPVVSVKKTSMSEEKPFQSIAHIASYLTEENAKKGEGVVRGKYPRASMFETYINYEYVDGKGSFYRLYFTGDKRELEYLCREMKANGDWCNILK